MKTESCLTELQRCELDDMAAHFAIALKQNEHASFKSALMATVHCSEENNPPNSNPNSVRLDLYAPLLYKRTAGSIHILTAYEGQAREALMADAKAYLYESATLAFIREGVMAATLEQELIRQIERVAKVGSTITRELHSSVAHVTYDVTDWWVKSGRPVL